MAKITAQNSPSSLPFPQRGEGKGEVVSSSVRKSLPSNGTYAVILAGGVGSRFWPLSRTLAPKQFLKLNGDKSLLQQTIRRILLLIPPQNIYIVGNHLHIYEIKRQISDFSIPKNNIILEPEGKNTAPAIGLAARFLSQYEPESTMIVLPADHLILNNKRFLNILKQAIRLAKKDYLVTLGIPPDTPHTGYGYIKGSYPLPTTSYQKDKAYRVEKFTEKPTLSMAKKFVKVGKFYWNSGMFVWKTKVILEEIRTYLPDLAEKLQELQPASDINPEIWSKIKAISIDYGVLEKSRRAAVVAADNIGWSDLGSWSALSQVLPRDKNGNIIQAHSIDMGSKDTIIWAYSQDGRLGNNRLIATIGLKNLVVVDTDDALLVCHKDRTEEVKKIVKLLRQKKFYQCRT